MARHGSAQHSKPTENIYQCISLHVWCLSMLIKKNDKAVHTGQPLQETFFPKWQWKNGVSLVAHANFFHSREQRSSKKGGRACDETHVTRTGKMRGEKNKFPCSSRELGTYGIYLRTSAVSFSQRVTRAAQSPNTINISRRLALATTGGRFNGEPA